MGDFFSFSKFFYFSIRGEKKEISRMVAPCQPHRRIVFLVPALCCPLPSMAENHFAISRR